MTKQQVLDLGYRLLSAEDVGKTFGVDLDVDIIAIEMDRLQEDYSGDEFKVDLTILSTSGVGEVLKIIYGADYNLYAGPPLNPEVTIKKNQETIYSKSETKIVGDVIISMTQGETISSVGDYSNDGYYYYDKIFYVKDIIPTTEPTTEDNYIYNIDGKQYKFVKGFGLKAIGDEGYLINEITNLSTDLGNKADKRPAQKTITTATTLALTDEGKVILANGALKVTIPLNSSVSFPIDTEIAIVRYGTGEVTIGTASGATLNGESSTTTFTLGEQYSSVALKKISTDAWLMCGAFEEVV